MRPHLFSLVLFPFSQMKTKKVMIYVKASYTYIFLKRFRFLALFSSLINVGFLLLSGVS